MRDQHRRVWAAIVPLLLAAFLSMGCGGLGVSVFGEEELPDEYIGTSSQSEPSQPSQAEEPSPEPEPRDSRLAEGEIYHVHLIFGDAMLDGGWYSVVIENPRNQWRDLVRWDCRSLSEYEEDYRFYDFPFKSDNFNTQDPAEMNGEYTLTIANSFGYEKQMSLTWSDGQFIDGGYAEYVVP